MVGSEASVEPVGMVQFFWEVGRRRRRWGWLAGCIVEGEDVYEAVWEVWKCVVGGYNMNAPTQIRGELLDKGVRWWDREGGMRI